MDVPIFFVSFAMPLNNISRGIHVKLSEKLTVKTKIYAKVLSNENICVYLYSNFGISKN